MNSKRQASTKHEPQQIRIRQRSPATTTTRRRSMGDRELLLTRKRALESRLAELQILPFKKKERKCKPGDVPTLSREKDTHWEYLLKEMKWLATDFSTERQAHATKRRKIAKAVNTHFAQAQSRYESALQKARLQQKKRALRLVKTVQSKYWGNIHRVITYQQKVEYDTQRNRAMNQQLVRLIGITETYNRGLQASVDNPIEAALLTTTSRTAAVVDYQQLDRESTYESSSDDSSYAFERERDDETTLIEQSAIESRQSMLDELRLLQQDAKVSVHQVVEELKGEPVEDQDMGIEEVEEDAEMRDDEIEDEDGEFQVNEADLVDDETTIRIEEQLPPEMAPQDELTLLQQENEMSIEELRRRYAVPVESDGAMRVDDEEEEENDEDDEFQVNEADLIDDETTIRVEEQLPPEMAPDEEIRLLQQENEMSVEELRRMYSGMNDEDNVVEEPARSSELKQLLENNVNDESDEFVPQETVDDETTMIAEENLGRDMSYEDELALLRSENEMSIDELRARYLNQSDGDADDEEEVEDEEPEGKEQADQTQPLRKRRRTDDVDPDEEVDVESAMHRLESSVELAKQTRATRPFLIPSWVKLREYQQIGLNWLVSLQARRLNGILADEMGLGKTLQTISLLAYLAAYKGIWGPHLIVVPTSVMLNWETELKRFCPGLKVLCYYGTAKRRKELRTGWTKSNLYHVVITSYQLVVQDAFAFKRKRWYYLVLDEAQHIKNFQSQRWQTLINFRTQRRLLLTGTPLQNNLMELWSLLHFLMPYIFRSRKEFSYWFANPMTSMIEGKKDQNESVVKRLHGIIRPFVLRRLKKDVETQLPGKFEHIVKCQLSRRQMFIYEEFMARSSTRHALRGGGNFMGMMNVLMQLRKVCNHPDLFEPRSVVTPFVLGALELSLPLCVSRIGVSHDPTRDLSPGLLTPVWCGSDGTPSIHSAFRHDPYVSQELLTLEATLQTPTNSQTPPCSEVEEVLHRLDGQIRDNEFQRRSRMTEMTKKINSHRCRRTPFVYNRAFIATMTVSESSLLDEDPDCLKSPSHLLSFRKTQQERGKELSTLIKRFVFAVPKACAHRPTLSCHLPTRRASIDGLEPIARQGVAPLLEAEARLSAFFPDKSLVQFDAGKLQTLAELLRERKRGGHKVLIFTQMSKMLDILESFLNLNGHTYLRLDGGTSVEKRQRLMDQFNEDPKIFCFILSTRSGGVGVNLTGADTVVFYDSDWNPAQDAQAQDRAHRIGQTREVHIFRLITENTIEENILVKARQKRNLDILVMDKGNFDASQLQREQGKVLDTSNHEETVDMYSRDGLLQILGVGNSASDDRATSVVIAKNDTTKLSAEQIEKTMTSLEDVDDANALQGARKEAAEEFKEFDESIEYKKDSDAEEEEEDGKKGITKVTKRVDGQVKDQQETEKKELEKEIAAWQDKVGMDPSAIKASLSPVERYGLYFSQDIDPYYSLYAVLEHERKQAEEQEQEDEIDIDHIEADKENDEVKAFEDGDLLCTFPQPEDLVRQRKLYLRERSRLKGLKKRRKLTGEDWESRQESLSNHQYWYNIDTGEATWEKPKVIIEMEAYDLAYRNRWDSTPLPILTRVMGFLAPCADRMNCSRVSRQWSKAARDISFIRHVYPVELGAYTLDDNKMETMHYRTIEAAVEAAVPGDTIELADGHYWVNSDVSVNFPLKFVGDEQNPANVVIELSGTFHWKASAGFIEGITIRRPKLSGIKASMPESLFRVESGRLDMVESILDNDGRNGPVVTVLGNGSSCGWRRVALKSGQNGVEIANRGKVELEQCIVEGHSSTGIHCSLESDVALTDCTIKGGTDGVVLVNKSRAFVKQCQFIGSSGLPLRSEDDCTVTSDGNQMRNPCIPSHPLPVGFSAISTTTTSNPIATEQSN